MPSPFRPDLDIILASQFKPGMRVSRNFILKKKIESLDELYLEITTKKSIFANGKMAPSSFFFNWQIRLVKIWIDRGWFWSAELDEQEQIKKKTSNNIQ